MSWAERRAALRSHGGADAGADHGGADLGADQSAHLRADREPKYCHAHSTARPRGPRLNAQPPINHNIGQRPG